MRTFNYLILVAVLVGCGRTKDTSPEMPPAAPPPPMATQFAPAQCGSVSGRVAWTGEDPLVEPIRNLGDKRANDSVANPHTPDIVDGGMIGVVIQLKNVDPALAKPWDHPPVAVEIGPERFSVRQGNRGSRVGFVRIGDSVPFTTAGGKIFGVRGQGAAFFTHMLPTAQPTVEHAFPAEGRVALSSASGEFWATADLFVSAHPYLTFTDEKGRFELSQVPAGTYDLVAWQPSWLSERDEMDAESGMRIRRIYKSPVEKTLKVTVPAGGVAQAAFAFTLDDFAPSATPAP